jgi:DNA helicase-2/ATP-dependent DNA helicase PcrA
VKANIQGRDIGVGLKALIRKMKAGDIVDLIAKLHRYEELELKKLNAKKRVPETKRVALEDRMACAYAFCDGAESVDDVLGRIDALFTEEAAGGGLRKHVLLSTVHRAKGLEADTVFILKPEWLPFPFAKLDWELEQEQNIRYVALTRSKHRLVFVPSPETTNPVEA